MVENVKVVVVAPMISAVVAATVNQLTLSIKSTQITKTMPPPIIKLKLSTLNIISNKSSILLTTKLLSEKLRYKM